MAEKRNTVTLGDVLISTDKGNDEPKKTKEGCQMYHLKVYLPDDVESITLRKGDFLNFRDITEEELQQMPEWKRGLAQIKCWFSLPKN